MSVRDPLDGLPAEAKARLRTRAPPKWVAHIEAIEIFLKRPNQSGECDEVVAAASLSFKNTMPVGFIMIFGWP